MRFDVEDLNLNERRVIERILKSATNKDYDKNIEMDQLHKELYEIIKGKRYLLVLYIDNSNGEICGQSLKSLFLGDCANGSKIIVASWGIKAVADFMSAVEPYIYKRSLDPEESWNLFKNVVSKNNGQEEEAKAMMNNPKIVEIGKSIVERCRGNPFTIRTIGRMLLSDMESENNNNNNLVEAKYWFSSFLEKFSRIPQQHINTLLVLKLGCYDILPLPLKRCFLYYCRLFPKGFEIESEILINLWVAQGFIYSDSSPEKSMEDAGYEYFKDLEDKYFFELTRRDDYFRDRSFETIGRKFCVPDPMHELGILVSGATRSTQYVSFELESSSKVPTSVAFQAKRLRALIVFRKDELGRETEKGLSQSICDKNTTDYKLLRVLNLHNSGVPNSIGNLKHLRYLDISGNPDIKALPNSITMLHCLITLKLSSCYGLKELPRDIKKLINLKHLEIDWCYSLTYMPRGLGQLTQLETLSEFVLSNYKKGNIGNSCSLKELAKLNNLRGELKIKNLGNSEDDYSYKILEAKEHLRSLTLSWDSTANVGVDNASKSNATPEKQLECLEPHPNMSELALVGYGGIKFSGWLSSLRNLTKFSLRQCNCQHLSPLSQVRSLRVLILDQMTNLEYIISKDVVFDSSAEDNLLTSLYEIRLTELPNLEGWWQEEHPTTTSSSPSSLPSFRRLRRLVIEDCPKLRSMPLYRNLRDYLVLDNTSFDTFQHTINACRSDSSFPFLRWLKTLCIIGIKKLDISQCDNIKWERFRNLRFLRLDYLPKLDKLPDGLQHLTRLEQLHIWRCNIKTLPEWIGNFKSLKNLGISVCPYLNSLPQALESLHRLETLEIEDCAILFQRCQRETGKDWDKIQHIPNLKIRQPQSSLSPRF
ncbi:putative disease resistance protein RGA1 [Ziziphus jujuba]|uniref:Disease resistance protein RGA1 n=1 Tax=Ziziphus jujuba TaxID=326968 RepID=A0ABM4A119_ZIZJJ|nr:putative disease resistance protein RGA1 [Ziziphus jujuba]